MTKTKTILLASALVLVLAGATIAVKMIFFPSVDEKFFQTSQTRLRQAPANVAIVRPTHFPKSPTNGMVVANVNGAMRMVGRNMTFQQLLATAYGYNPGRITLPPAPPNRNFDFLVTVPKDPTGRLQLAIKRKLGFTARREMRDTEVLALKVEDPNSPGLKVSTGGATDISARNGRLYLTHMQMANLVNLVEQVLKMPVVDKTGLTNYYDFSMDWDAQTQQQAEGATMDRQTGRKILAEWGLGLEPDTASIEMLVVEKAK